MRKPLKLECRTSSVQSDTHIVPVLQDAGKKPVPPKGPYRGLVERFRKSRGFDASAKAVEFVRFGGKDRAQDVLFMGLGQAGELTPEIARRSAAIALKCLESEKCRTAVFLADPLLSAKGIPAQMEIMDVMLGIAEGFTLGHYKINAVRSDSAKGKDTDELEKLIFVTGQKGAKRGLDKTLEEAMAAGEAVALTRDWSNLPSNIGTPVHFASEAQKLARKYGLKCKILRESDAKREGMGMFLGVGQGSHKEGRIVVLEYVPKGVTKPKTVALVGKGITFDTGGVSLKPASGMEEMKHDMTGAAMMAGAVVLASRLKVSNKVVAVLGFTENKQGGDAINPGDVLTARNGKTVEVLNTDAEGRLILGDLLDYACDYKPAAVIDAATLTGAVVIALGKYACAILGNDDGLMEGLKRAGEKTGERMWELPMYADYLDDMKSEYADLKNIGVARQAGTITAAKFLEQFVKKGIPWAHLDIACTGWDQGYLPYNPSKGGSGMHVRAVARFLQDF